MRAQGQPQAIAFPLCIYAFVDAMKPATWYYNESFRCLSCADVGGQITFPISLPGNTVISSIRIKWGANHEDDGILVNIYHRNEDAAGFALTEYIENEVFTVAASPTLTQVDSIDMLDVATGTGKVFFIEINADTVTEEIHLFSIIVETKIRFT